MSKHVRKAAMVVWCLSMAWRPITTAAQERTIPGIVVDQSGAPVAGAHVSVGAAAGGPRASATVSDREGRFVVRVPADAAGPLVVDKDQFEQARLDVPRDGRPVRIVLVVAAVTERVTVVPPIVDTNAIDGFGSLSTVVSAAQVEQLNAVDLASALRRTPGVTISRFDPVGAFGGEAGGAVFIRGTGASRPGSEIKAYVDGVPFYMGIWGHPLLDLLPVSTLERVQVHKGPQPQLFGNAFSAIDLGTRRAAGDGLDGGVRVSAGSFATFVEQADLTGRAGPWDFAAAQGFARSGGQREDGDGRLASAFGRLGYRWSPRWSVSGTLLHVDNDAGDPGVIGRPETKTGRFATSGTLGALALEHAHGRATGSLQVYANRGSGDWRGQPAPDGDTLTRFALAGVRWREQVAPWTGTHVSVGLDVDRIDGSVEFDRVAPAPRGRFEGDALTLVAPHVAVDQVIGLGRGWSLQPSAGFRSYAHSVFESSTAPHAGLVVRGPGTVAMRVNYARGVSYPGQEVVALSQLIPPLADSWRDLRPETLRHVEAGVSWSATTATTIDAAWFHDRITDRYVFAFPPVVASPTFTNLGAHVVRGLEATLQQRIGGRWHGFAGLTLLDASLPRLPYAPERSLVLGVTGAIGPVRIAADAQAQSGMWVLARARAFGATNADRVDGFTVVNLRPSWLVPGLGGRTELFVAIENLFDEAYAYRPGYPMPGIAAQVGVTLRSRPR